MTLLGSLFAYYKLDEATGSVADDSTGSYDGISTGVNINQDGKIGNSYNFSGNAAYIDIGSGDITFGPGSPFSVSTWLNPNVPEDTNDRTIISSIQDASPFRGYQLFYKNQAATKRFECVSLASSNNYFADWDYTANNGSWIHVVFTWNASNDARCYVNGSELSRTGNTGNWAGTTPNLPTYIGGRYNKAAQSWFGRIDEVGIWNRVISIDEIRDLYNEGDGLTYPFPDGPTVNTVNINETVDFSETLTAEHVREPIVFSRSINETTDFSETLTTQHVGGVSTVQINEDLGFVENLQVQHVGAIQTVGIDETVALSETVSVVRANRTFTLGINETVGLTEVLDTKEAAQVFTVSISETTGFSEAVTPIRVPRIFPEAIYDIATFTENLSVNFIHTPVQNDVSIGETLDFSEIVSPLFHTPSALPPNYLAKQFINGLNNIIRDSGKVVGIRYFNKTTGSVYDDDNELTISGTLWTSGVIFPLDTTRGSTDSVLLEQGKLIDADKRLYVNGSLSFTGSEDIIKVIIGSPDGDAYTTIPDGGIMYSVGCTPIYKKQYLRRLTTGSLNGE